MRTTFKALVLTGATALALGGVSYAPAANADVAAGTWDEDVPSSSSYQSSIQQPIDADGSSTWQAKRGQIPVKFKVTATSTKAFQSLQSGGVNAYSALNFTPTSLTVSQLTSLSAAYSFTTGSNHGGSLRWSISTPVGEVFVYYGDEPNYTGTPNQSGTNMIADTSALRVDTGQVGGTFYDTWAHALELVGSQPVNRASLVLDGGWGGDQILNLSSAEVNGNSHAFVAGSSTTQTNAAPAYITLTRLGPADGDPVDENLITSVQGDTGKQYRQVDGMYMYNLDLKALNLGSGQYRVFISVNHQGAPDNGFADFTLR
jgi:hypothetical protein